MQIKQTVNGATLRLSLEGRFDFHSHRDFRNAYEGALATQGIHEIDINFSQVDYLDSSALGMMLLLREKAESNNKRVVLSSLRGTVKQVLEIANFSRLFTIRD